MRLPRTLRWPSILCLCLLSFVVACSDSATGPDKMSVAGDWHGITSFTSQGRTTSMSLSQSGTTVTGTFTVAGAFIGITLTGEVSPSGRFSFLAPHNCEVWGGTLTLNGNELAGPIIIDYSGCSGQSNESATLTLTR